MRKKLEQLEDLHSVHHVSSCMLSVAWKDPRVHLMPSFHYHQILNCLLIQRSTFFFFAFSSVQFSHSVVSDSLRPHELQHASLPVHHHLPEFTQIHVPRVGDAIQPSRPLLSPSPPAPNPSQHQSLF